MLNLLTEKQKNKQEITLYQPSNDEVWRVISAWVAENFRKIKKHVLRKYNEAVTEEDISLFQILGYETYEKVKSKKRPDLFEPFFFLRIRDEFSKRSRINRSEIFIEDFQYREIKTESIEWLPQSNIPTAAQASSLMKFIQSSPMTDSQKRTWYKYLFLGHKLSNSQKETLNRSIKKVKAYE